MLRFLHVSRRKAPEPLEKPGKRERGEKWLLVTNNEKQYG